MKTNERPSLALYHANGKGTGSAMKMELYPLKIGNLDSGAIYATLAPQKAVAERISEAMYPRFDWDAAISAKLEFADLAKILQVFCGEAESLEDGKGLFKQTRDWCQIIKLAHVIEPVPGYRLEFSQNVTLGGDMQEERHTRIFLSTAEALGLSHAIEGSMAAVCFGVYREGGEA